MVTARFQFLQPTTLTVYQNEIHANPTPAPPLYNCLSGVVAATLGGAFIRTNLLLNTNLNACNTSQFYVGSPIQQYAQSFHAYGVNHLAYSFGYDDTCGQSSYINIDDPTGFSITVGGKPAAAHDFNGDGKSDIAWRDSSGNVALWLMNGTQSCKPRSLEIVRPRLRSSDSATSTATARATFSGATPAAMSRCG